MTATKLGRVWMLAALLLIPGVLAASRQAQAQSLEPAGVKLLRPDSLAGWDARAKTPAHWVISDGRLSGNAQSTPLVSGWTVGDFELRFSWSVESGGAWMLNLLDVPGGPGLQILLREGDGCGNVRDGEKSLAEGTSVSSLETGKLHTADVRRSGSVLSVIVDGRVTSEINVMRNRRFGIGLAVPAGEAAITNLRLQEPRGNSLFNGRDASGWFVNNDRGTWAVEDGAFTATSHRGLHYLRTDKEYANFTVSFEYKISRGGNSGVAIRTATGGWPSGDGMELQILDQPGLVKDSTMSIYGNLPPLDRADKSETWNRVVIKAEGRMVSAWVNDELVQQSNTSKLSEIKHRHLKGWFGLQDHGGKVRFREIYMHEAPDGLGLDVWYQPTPEPPAQVVLDRLMNSERLAREDHLGSAVVTKTVTSGGEHVLAELTGPGALVDIWRSAASGRIAFYFDGETQPRIECPADQLAANLPSVAHQEQPLLTCLTFAKSLKIVLSEPVAATYRLGYVTLPADAAVDSFSFNRTGIPRGTLEAITYRHDGLSGGKLREAEIYDRINSEPRTIEPGTSVELARLEGAGLVNWLKLRAARTVLANNDLWLEVTIDGESVPAIAAPARFLFPAYGTTIDGREFNTLIMAGREGFANLLAMPYGAGLTVSARNRGDKPIESVAVSMSVDRATDANGADYAKRMRLRGVFQTAGSLVNDLVRQAGAGRWVSLVCEGADGAPCGAAALVVDGQTCEGWAMSDLDPFWGRPGESKDFYRSLSGRRGNLAWRYMLLEPVNFQHSLVLMPNPGDKLGDRLALFYMK